MKTLIEILISLVAAVLRAHFLQNLYHYARSVYAQTLEGKPNSQIGTRTIHGFCAGHHDFIFARKTQPDANQYVTTSAKKYPEPKYSKSRS
jgi:hypothetical protein